LPDREPSELGLWSALPLIAQREGLSMKSQACLSNLQRIRGEPTDQA
jgi:hypothetical protein